LNLLFYCINCTINLPYDNYFTGIRSTGGRGGRGLSAQVWCPSISDYKYIAADSVALTEITK